MVPGNADLLCEMLATRGEMLQQLQGLRQESAGIRPEPEEWSVVEVLQHVADIDQLMVRRLSRVLAGEAELAPYNSLDWEAQRREAERAGLAGILCRVYAVRTDLLQAVSNLTGTDMEKSAVHPARGAMSVRGMVEMIIRHDRDHAGQISKTRAVVER